VRVGSDSKDEEFGPSTWLDCSLRAGLRIWGGGRHLLWGRSSLVVGARQDSQLQEITWCRDIGLLARLEPI
jgi:hypothetical protein